MTHGVVGSQDENRPIWIVIFDRAMRGIGLGRGSKRVRRPIGTWISA